MHRGSVPMPRRSVVGDESSAGVAAGTFARRGARRVYSSLLLVFVVAAPPLVRRRLRVALGRLLPALLAAKRRYVEQRPDAAKRLDAASGREVRAEYLLAVAQEDAQTE